MPTNEDEAQNHGSGNHGPITVLKKTFQSRNTLVSILIQVFTHKLLQVS